MVLVGPLLAAAGFAWQAQATASCSYWPAMLGPELLISFGSGLVLTPVAALMTSAASPSDGGIVSGLVNAARQVGGSLGLTALVTIATSAPRAGPAARVASGLAHDYDRSFLAAAIAVLTAVLAAIVLPRRQPAAEPANPAHPARHDQGGQ
jgi:sugar phosphate permease